jgi:hypothetical protein
MYFVQFYYFSDGRNYEVTMKLCKFLLAHRKWENKNVLIIFSDTLTENSSFEKHRDCLEIRIQFVFWEVA